MPVQEVLKLSTKKELEKLSQAHLILLIRSLREKVHHRMKEFLCKEVPYLNQSKNFI